MSLIPDNISITACQVWQTLLNLYERNDISLQFSIRNQISTLCMKGASDAEKYVAAHTVANERLARMGVCPADSDAVYALLRGLLSSSLWPMIRKGIKMEIQCNGQQIIATQRNHLFTLAVPMGSTSLPHIHVSTLHTTRDTSNNPFLSPPCYGMRLRPHLFHCTFTTFD